LILRNMLGEEEFERLSVKHPVTSYDSRYFDDLSSPADRPVAELKTFDAKAHGLAQIAAMRNDLEKRCPRITPGKDGSLLDLLALPVRSALEQRLRIPVPPERSKQSAVRNLVLPIAALRRYLECPLQGAARYALGLFEQEDDEIEDPDEEPVDQTFLDRTILLREALWRGRGKLDEIENAYLREFQDRMMRGHAPTGPFAEAAHKKDLAKLSVGIEQVKAADVANLDGWQQIAIGGANESLAIDRALPELVLEVNEARPDGTKIQSIKLRGVIGPISADLKCSIRCVAGSKAKPQDFLDGFLGSIVLAAAGEKMPAVFTALAVGGDSDQKNLKKFCRSFSPLLAGDAREYLTELCRDLLSDENVYFLPIEAVQEIIDRKSTEDRAIKEVIDSLRDNEFHPCRSDYGPVADARSFPSCDPARAREILQRRFGPLKAIFEK
jgi:exodeoxyribonuclease V gamma subunit